MNTTEDFKNAPIGATATHNDGGRAMKTRDAGRSWVTPGGSHLDDKEMAYWGYTLDPLPPLPPFPPFPHTTARDALDLAWELAYPVKEGQVIPEGDVFLSGSRDHFTCEKAYRDTPVGPSGANWFRTLDPLPEPEPDWLNAPAVLARAECYSYRRTWVPAGDGYWVSVEDGLTNWDALIDVTPLWPKEDA